MNEVAEMIRNDHEFLDQDEQLLEELEVQELEEPVIETPTQIIDTTQSQIEQDTSDDDVEFIAVSYSNESISRGMKSTLQDALHKMRTWMKNYVVDVGGTNKIVMS